MRAERFRRPPRDHPSVGERQRYPKGTDEAIWTMLVVGMKPGQILDSLAAGDAGLPEPILMPARTLRAKVERLKQDRGDPADSLPLESEPNAYAALRRRVIEKAGRDLEELCSRDADVRDIDRIGKWMQVLGRIEEDIRKDPHAVRAARERHEGLGPKPNLLAEIAKAEEARERDPSLAGASMATRLSLRRREPQRKRPKHTNPKYAA